MVQNQAKVTQLAPATNEKSSCLQELHRRSLVSLPHGDYKLPGGRTASGQELCLGQNTNSGIYRACYSSKGLRFIFFPSSSLP